MSVIDPITGALVGCDSCVHRRGETRACEAFPRGIPWPILSGEVDHRVPWPGDNGIVYRSVGLDNSE